MCLSDRPLVSPALRVESAHHVEKRPAGHANAVLERMKIRTEHALYSWTVIDSDRSEHALN